MITPDHFHDALGHLDDDLIAQTDALRQRPRRRILPFIIRISAAACACLLIGVAALQRTSTPKVVPETTVSSHDAPPLFYSSSLSTEEFDYTSENGCSRGPSSSVIDIPVDEEPLVDTVTTTRSRRLDGVITAWQEDGFCLAVSFSTVEGIVANDSVRATFTNTTGFTVGVDGCVIATAHAPSESDLPIGTPVSVHVTATDPTSLTVQCGMIYHQGVLNGAQGE